MQLISLKDKNANSFLGYPYFYIMSSNSPSWHDFISWDVVNWSRAMRFWSPQLEQKKPTLTCLELGGNAGGLSLYLAHLGHHVVCSDIQSPEEKAQVLHSKFELSGQITYRAVDATNIPFEAELDVVTFKSILGGIGRVGQEHLTSETIKQIHKSLKPGGQLVFTENLQSSLIHRFMRKRFVRWGSYWNYLRYEEIETLLSVFSTVEYKTYGFFGAFGRNEQQRNVLGKIDALIEVFIPKSWRYIISVRATK